MFNKMNFENFTDYLLSLNISQISREYGFKKVGLLEIVFKYPDKDIEELAIRGKENCEIAGRSEVNIIDVLYALLDLNIKKEDIRGYMKESKIKLSFGKQMFIGKVFDSERCERENLIRKINSNNVCETTSIPENIMKCIPKPLKIFPRDFALKETEMKLEVNEETKKGKSPTKILEKKSLEDIISSNNYYDLSKKHNKRKASVDLVSLLNEVAKTENISIGRKFKSTNNALPEKDSYNKKFTINTSTNNDHAFLMNENPFENKIEPEEKNNDNVEL